MLAYFVLTNGEHPFGATERERIRNMDGGTVVLTALEQRVTSACGTSLLLHPNGASGGAAESLDSPVCALVYLLKWMLTRDTTARPSAARTLKHPAFWSVDRAFNFLCIVGNQSEVAAASSSGDSASSRLVDLLPSSLLRDYGSAGSEREWTVHPTVWEWVSGKRTQS
jgi:hypothetical protein